MVKIDNPQPVYQIGRSQETDSKKSRSNERWRLTPRKAGPTRSMKCRFGVSTYRALPFERGRRMKGKNLKPIYLWTVQLFSSKDHRTETLWSAHLSSLAPPGQGALLCKES
jgi:hypothetical protein